MAQEKKALTMGLGYAPSLSGGICVWQTISVCLNVQLLLLKKSATDRVAALQEPDCLTFYAFSPSQNKTLGIRSSKKCLYAFLRFSVHLPDDGL